jgi:hypothetical protein
MKVLTLGDHARLSPGGASDSSRTPFSRPRSGERRRMSAVSLANFGWTWILHGFFRERLGDVMLVGAARFGVGNGKLPSGGARPDWDLFPEAGANQLPRWFLLHREFSPWTAPKPVVHRRRETYARDFFGFNIRAFTRSISASRLGSLPSGSPRGAHARGSSCPADHNYRAGPLEPTDASSG